MNFHSRSIEFRFGEYEGRNIFEFYQTIADRLLPFLKDRPVTLERRPEGLVEV
jgi:DNA primase